MSVRYRVHFFKSRFLCAALVGLALSFGACQSPDNMAAQKDVSKNAADKAVSTDGLMGAHTSAAAHAQTHDMDMLPVEKRIAFMSGHVEAGLALYRAGVPEQAAKHLLHPVSETHAAERAGIDALGFDQSIFIQVSEALENGQSAKDIEPLLLAAQKNLAEMATQAGGDSRNIIRFLMDTTEEEYSIGVTEGMITDPGEYQDAFGFTVVALKHAKNVSLDAGRDPLIAALLDLLSEWPQNGPLIDIPPSPKGEVIAKIDSVREILN